MISINRIFFVGAVGFAIAAAVMASGCSTAGGMQRAAEVRVATTLDAGSPKLVVSGPARLLHVDVQGHHSLSIYSVKRGAGGAVNCGDKPGAEARPLRQAASNALNLVVAENEAICVANDGRDVAPRNADISWHARRGADAPAETDQDIHASNL
jgi:hypothetical protein